MKYLKKRLKHDPTQKSGSKTQTKSRTKFQTVLILSKPGQMKSKLGQR